MSVSAIAASIRVVVTVHRANPRHSEHHEKWRGGFHAAQQWDSDAYLSHDEMLHQLSERRFATSCTWAPTNSRTCSLGYHEVTNTFSSRVYIHDVSYCSSSWISNPFTRSRTRDQRTTTESQVCPCNTSQSRFAMYCGCAVRPGQCVLRGVPCLAEVSGLTLRPRHAT